MTQGSVNGAERRQAWTGSVKIAIDGSAWPWKLNSVSLSSGVPGGLESGAHETPGIHSGASRTARRQGRQGRQREGWHATRPASPGRSGNTTARSRRRGTPGTPGSNRRPAPSRCCRRRGRGRRLPARRGADSDRTITGPLNTSSGRRRLEGYRKAVGPGLPATLTEQGDWSPGSGRQAARELLARHPGLDGLFVASDLMAVEAMAVLREACRASPGRGGGRLRRLGGRHAADPPLTTMHQSFETSAAEAVRILNESDRQTALWPAACADADQAGAQAVRLRRVCGLGLVS